MKHKIEKSLSPAEFADYLASLAERIRQGEIQAGEHSFRLPAQVAVEIKHKEKKGRFNGRIKFSWSTLADYDETARQEVIRWETSFKAVKKRMAAQLARLQQAAAAGILPPKAQLMQFVQDSRQMAAMAEPEWKPAVEEYMDHLENLLRAVEDQQLEVARHELRDLTVRMRQCHRDFK